MLLDPRWFKWMLQSGTSRRAYPRYWQIGQLQDKWPGAVLNLPGIWLVRYSRNLYNLVLRLSVHLRSSRLDIPVFLVGFLDGFSLSADGMKRPFMLLPRLRL